MGSIYGVVMACIYGSNGVYIWEYGMCIYMGVMACVYMGVYMGSNGMYTWE